MLSRFPLITFFYARTSPSEHALGETTTHEIDLDRHADHLPSHRDAGFIEAPIIPSLSSGI